MNYKTQERKKLDKNLFESVPSGHQNLVNLLRSSCFLSLAIGTYLIFFWHRSIVLQYGKIGNFISPKPLRHRELAQKGSIMKFSRWVIGVLCRKCHIQWGSVFSAGNIGVIRGGSWVLNIKHCEKICMNNKNNSDSGLIIYNDIQ